MLTVQLTLFSRVVLLAAIRTDDPEELVTKFSQILSIPRNEAEFYLQGANFNLETAVNLYLDAANQRRSPTPGNASNNVRTNGSAFGTFGFANPYVMGSAFGAASSSTMMGSAMPGPTYGAGAAYSNSATVSRYPLRGSDELAEDEMDDPALAAAIAASTGAEINPAAAAAAKAYAAAAEAAAERAAAADPFRAFGGGAGSSLGAGAAAAAAAGGPGGGPLQMMPGFAFGAPQPWPPLQQQQQQPGGANSSSSGGAGGGGAAMEE